MALSTAVPVSKFDLNLAIKISWWWAGYNLWEISVAETQFFSVGCVHSVSYILESIFVLHRISQPSLQRRFIFGCEFKKIIFISMASHLGLAFFSRDQRQLGKDLLIVYAKCLFLVGVLYFISLFRILTAWENLFILILFCTMRRPFNLG